MPSTPARITAAQWLEDDPLFLDTETTGLDSRAELCELAVLDRQGAPILVTLIRPTVPIPAGATWVHGITDRDVAAAPTFAEAWPSVRALLAGRDVVVYNADFDSRLLSQSAEASHLAPVAWHTDAGLPGQPRWRCAMKLYAQFHAEQALYRRERWLKLNEAARHCGLSLPDELHRARADAELTRRLVLHMAGASPQILR